MNGNNPHKLNDLFAANREWVKRKTQANPEYFSRLAKQQAPEYLWIGCSDSRVPANQIVHLAPGEIFVHRNIANVVVHSDLNCLSVIQYAVDALKVKHIMVVGHYGCGGVRAALARTRSGLVDNWLRHVQDVGDKHGTYLGRVINADERHARLCELNVIEQVVNVCNTTIVQDAWARKQDLTIHGWIYGIHDGKLHDLGISVQNNTELLKRYQRVITDDYQVKD
jgi:carbonic anhydrase